MKRLVALTGLLMSLLLAVGELGYARVSMGRGSSVSSGGSRYIFIGSISALILIGTVWSVYSSYKDNNYY